VVEFENKRRQKIPDKLPTRATFFLKKEVYIKEIGKKCPWYEIVVIN
jgi:hypothetical protein